MDDREDQSESIKKDRKKSRLFGDHDQSQLWIKLRIPKDEKKEEEGLGEEEEEEEDDDEDRMSGYPRWVEEKEDDNSQQHQFNHNNNNNSSTGNIITRICQVCNKGFRSGKALGGHMRVHFQTNKDLIFSKKLSKTSQPINKFKKQKRERSNFAKKKHLNYKSQSGGGGIAGLDNKVEVEVPTCSLCGKNFPSMKSLFGHMRCHPDREWRGIQPPPQPQPQPQPHPVKTSPFSSVSDAEPQYSHDDDDDQADSAVADGDQEGVDLTKSLGGWSVTAKRGRKSISCNSEDEGMRNAVFHLMSLAQGDSFEAKLVNDHGAEGFEATNRNSLMYKTENEDISKRVPGSKKRRHEEISGGYMNDNTVKELRNEDSKIDGIQLNNVIHMFNAKAAKQTDFLAGKYESHKWEDINWPKEYAESKDFSGDESSDSKNTHVKLLNHKNYESSHGKLVIVKNKKKRKKMKLRDLESVHDPTSTPVRQNPASTMTNSLEKFRCTTCDKCFPTHQALGGHRSSHNKSRIFVQNDFGESTCAADEEDENLGNYYPAPVEESKESDEGAGSSKLVEGSEGGIHPWKICNRNFPTGQALGGHRRYHRIGRMEAPSSQVNSAGEVFSNGSGRVIEFDLNKEPPMEDDAANEPDGYVSSSYNSVEYPFL